MSVSMLLVEGNLDMEIMRAMLDGRPLVEQAGSKNGLAPKTMDSRRKGNVSVCYLRDRDFDYDPPEDFSSPIVDRVDGEHGGSVLGWRWSRHEIENYMLEPSVVSTALDIPENEFVEKLIDAAARIVYYQAARWTIGCARRSLPPQYELDTKPSKNEFHCPDDCSDEASSKEWACDCIREFRCKVYEELSDSKSEESYCRYLGLLNKAIDDGLAQILLWFAGKDLMESLFKGKGVDGIGGARDFRRRIRDWMIVSPESVITKLIEWKNLLDTLRRN